MSILTLLLVQFEKKKSEPLAIVSVDGVDIYSASLDGQVKTPMPHSNISFSESDTTHAAEIDDQVKTINSQTNIVFQDNDLFYHASS